MPTHARDLEPLFRELFADRRFMVVSNREPYEHRWSDEVGEMEVRRPAGGLTSALDPLLQALGGMWVAWGSGEADAAAVDAANRVRVPPEDPSYTLRRVWLTHHDIHRYYLGFSNQFLWPLCHLRPDLTRVRSRYWERYRRVNRRFADAVLEEVRGKEAAVWFQDYHLALAPLLVRGRRPDLTLAHFWHIPFPPIDIFRLAPQAEYLLRGLLANDLVGFHLPTFADNFLRCSQRLAGAEVDWGARTATLDGHTCHVGAFPISIDVEQFRAAASVPDAPEAMARIRQRYAPGGGAIGVGSRPAGLLQGAPREVQGAGVPLGPLPRVSRALHLHPGGGSQPQRHRGLRRPLPEGGPAGARDQRALRDRRVAADPPGEAVAPRRAAGRPLPARRRVHHQLAPGRDEPGGQGVRGQPGGPPRRAPALRVRRGGRGDAEATLINPYDPEGSALRIRDALTLPADERAGGMERLQGSLGTIYDWMGDLFAAWGAVAASRPAEAAPVAGEGDEGRG
jgi:trehalose-6-phosphate synthase